MGKLQKKTGEAFSASEDIVNLGYEIFDKLENPSNQQNEEKDPDSNSPLRKFKGQKKRFLNFNAI